VRAAGRTDAASLRVEPRLDAGLLAAARCAASRALGLNLRDPARPDRFKHRLSAAILRRALRAPTLLAMAVRNLDRTRMLLFLLLAGPAGAAPAPEPAPEYQLKSAFIYNFATFIAWPEDIGSSLTLCVAVPQDEMKYFSSLEGRPVGKMKVAVRRLERDDSAEGCRILFVSDAESAGLDDWLSDVADQQVLTVAESEDWLKKGVMMDLLLHEKRVVFDVNVEAARGEGIVINSRLLRLARKVYGLESADDPPDNAEK